MSHLLSWSYLNFVQCHLLKQVQIETRLIQTWYWNITTMEYHCCAWMVCSLSFLLLHPTCVTSTLPNERNKPLLKKPKKKYDVSHKFKNIWAMQLLWGKMFKSDHGKIIVWNALYVPLWRERVLFWVQNYLCFKRMQERQKLSGTCHIWARRKESFMWTKNATSQNWSNIFSMKSYFHYWIGDSRRFEGGKGRERANFCHNFASITVRPTYAKVWDHEITIWIFQCSHEP